MIDTIGERLKKARKYAGMTQLDLAKAIDAKQGAISDLENGRNNSSTKLVEMAICTGVNAKWLSTGKGKMVAESKECAIPSNINQLCMYPIYHYEQIGRMLKCEQVKTDDFEPVVKISDENAYWIVIEDDSMQTIFQPKNLVLINPSLTPAPGDYVIATDHADKVMLRKWRDCGFDEMLGQEYTQLIALNPDYPNTDSRFSNFKIHGVATEHRIKLR